MMTLFLAICLVESGADKHTPDGKAGEVGIAQIMRICVDDCNRIWRLKHPGAADRWTDGDRKSVVESWKMFRCYVGHYAGPCDRTAKWAERAARTWVGGPKGPQRQSSKPYWRKVKAQLRLLQGD